MEETREGTSSSGSAHAPLMEALAAALRPVLAESASARELARAAGGWLIAEAERAGAGAGEAAKPVKTDAAPAEASAPVAGTFSAAAPVGAKVEPVARARVAMGAPNPAVKTGIVQLRIGDAVVHVDAAGTTDEIGRARQSAAREEIERSRRGGEGFAGWEGADEEGGIDFGLVRQRCALKAQSCELAIARRGQRPGSEEDAASKERLDRLIAQAKALPNCFLWVLWKERTQPGDEVLRTIAGCYAALSEAAELMQRVEEARGAGGNAGATGEVAELTADAMRMLAEAGSALRAALESTWLTSADMDQEQVHHWLRRAGLARSIYIERHMRLDDPADPEEAGPRRARIAALARRLERAQAEGRAIKTGVGQVRYHAKRLDEGDAQEQAYHAGKVVQSIAKLLSQGLAATDPRLRDALEGGAAKRVLMAGAQDAGLLTDGRVRAALEHAAGAEARGVGESEDLAHASRARAWGPEVLALRPALRGKRMVVIGGERNAEAMERLEEAFELGAVEWVELVEHGPGGAMRAPIARPDTAVVLLIIKLTGHLHADEARAFAQEADKPLVHLTAGYGPERVAHEIVQQASRRLGVGV